MLRGTGNIIIVLLHYGKVDVIISKSEVEKAVKPVSDLLLNDRICLQASCVNLLRIQDDFVLLLRNHVKVRIRLLLDCIYLFLLDAHLVLKLLHLRCAVVQSWRFRRNLCSNAFVEIFVHRFISVDEEKGIFYLLMFLGFGHLYENDSWLSEKFVLPRTQRESRFEDTLLVWSQTHHLECDLLIRLNATFRIISSHSDG